MSGAASLSQPLSPPQPSVDDQAKVPDTSPQAPATTESSEGREDDNHDTDTAATNDEWEDLILNCLHSASLYLKLLIL